jgi:ribosomal protein S18 acetylase RimI-like enzyme
VTDNLEFKVKQASMQEISEHLHLCDTQFSPRLSLRVDIHEYAIKLFEKSTSFEAWDQKILVGLVAAYLNDSEKRRGFVSNVSVLKKYTKQGIAMKLMKMCVEFAKVNQFEDLTLEVMPINVQAIALYTGLGFRVVDKSGSSLLMELEL